MESNKEYIRAKRIAFQLLKFRARSEKEIVERLRKKKKSQDSITKVIDFLKKTKLLDDYEFARSWANSRLSKQLGIKRISFELKQKGIKQEIIEEVLNSVKTRYKETDVILDLAKKRLARLSNIEESKAKQRVYNFLIRRGFSLDTINEVIQEL